MEFPKLEKGQLAVLMAASATGHVLTINQKVSISDADKIYIVFNNAEEVYGFIDTKGSFYKTIEFGICNHNHTLVEYITAVDFT